MLGLALLAAATSGVAPGCDSPIDHVTERACAVSQLNRVNAQMDFQFHRVLRHLQQDIRRAKVEGREGEWPQPGDHYVSALVASQRAWTLARSQFCEAEQFTVVDGNSHVEVRADCETRFARQRIADLKSLYSEISE